MYGYYLVVSMYIKLLEGPFVKRLLNKSAYFHLNMDISQ